MESDMATDLERGAESDAEGPTPPTESHATDDPSENAEAALPEGATEPLGRRASATTDPGSPASSSSSEDDDPFEVTVPMSANPGDTLHVDVGGETELVVRVPPGAEPGQTFRVPRAKRHRASTTFSDEDIVATPRATPVFQRPAAIATPLAPPGDADLALRLQRSLDAAGFAFGPRSDLTELEEVVFCVEINQCVGCPDNSSLSHFAAMTRPGGRAGSVEW